MSDPKTYVIPSHKLRPGLLLAAFPAGLAFGLCYGVLAGSKDLAEAGFSGLVLGMLAYVVMAVPKAIYLYRKQRASWAKHSYAWYVATFPECLQRGRLSCRHCQSTSIRVQNLMEHSYTRAHVCAQCGETLYYSPEKR